MSSFCYDWLSSHLIAIIYQIVCPGINAAGLDEPLTLWVGRYWSGSRSPTGRGSKAYIALDVKRSRLVFLKDYWCARHPTVHPELEIYERFRKAEKPPSYVAHCLGGGPVLTDGREQVTLTQSLLERIWISSVPVERFHYRFVLQEVGRPLETFKNSEQLIDLIHQAFLGTCERLNPLFSSPHQRFTQPTSRRGSRPIFYIVTSAQGISSSITTVPRFWSTGI